LEYITEFARRGLKRKGLDLLGVLPHRHLLSSPTMESIQEVLQAERLNEIGRSNILVDSVVIGAMGAQNAITHFKRGCLVITPGDREDVIKAAVSAASDPSQQLAGIILTENLRPDAPTMRLVEKASFPVLLAAEDSYEVASRVHNMTVKTRPGDTEKISVIRDIIAANVDVNKILRAL